MAQQKSNTVVFVASIFRDLVAVCPRFPRPGETLAGSEFFTGFGGKVGLAVSWYTALRCVGRGRTSA